MVRIIVLASGNGGNFEEIAKRAKNGAKIEIAALITDNPQAYAIQRAKNHGIPAEVIGYSSYQGRKQYEEELYRIIQKYKPELIVLAGYMRILKSKEILNTFKNRIINLHPSLLPAFPGAHGIQDAYDHGVKLTGITIHFVDEGLDSGPIIFQAGIRIKDGMSADELERKMHLLEHKHLWRVIESFEYGTYVVQGRRTNYVAR